MIAAQRAHFFATLLLLERQHHGIIRPSFLTNIPRNSANLGGHMNAMSHRLTGLNASLILTLFLGVAAHAQTVAYYVFNEGAAGTAASGATGAIIDSSSNGYDGTAINSPVYSSSVPANPIPLTGQSNPTSLSFNGSSQYVLVPNSDAGLSLTQSLTL